MKKLFLSLVAIAAMVFASSCQQEKMEAELQGGSTVSYTVEIPNAVATRAIGDGNNVNQLVYAVYRVTGENEATAKTTLNANELVYQTTASINPQNNSTVINLDLINDQSYLILFWAQVEDKWFASTYEFGTARVKYPNPNDYRPNSDDYAAFSGVDYISVDGSMKKSITLTRPFGQLNLATYLPDPDLYEPIISTTAVTVKGAANNYDVATGKAVQSDIEFKATAPITSETFQGYDKYLSMNYVFVAEEKATVEVEYTVVTESHGTVKNKIGNVPIAKNYKTNIVGNLLTSKVDYNVTLEKGWSGAEDVHTINNSTDLEIALQQNLEHIVIDLGAATTKSTASTEYIINPTKDQNGTFVWGGESTKTITINGNGNKLNFNYTNGDSQSIKCANPEAKIIINDVILTNSGENNGPWNRHDIYFSTPVELNRVNSDKALALRSNSKLTDVIISDVHPDNSEAYGIWIVPVGQTVDLNKVTITPSTQKTTDRAIKIDKQYLSSPDEIKQVTLNIKNSTFVSQKKSAVLVNSPAGAIINWGEGNNIEGVAEDPINAVWVDDGATDTFDRVEVNGATKVLEGSQKSVLVKSAGELQNAITNAVEGTNEIAFGANITGNVTIPQNEGIDIIINGLGKKYDGTITIDGNSRNTGAETLLIKNINFDHSGSDLYFIEQNSADETVRYPHNVTVEDCTFKGDGTNTICGIRYRQGYNNAVKDCTAEGLYLFMWTTGGNKITIDNVDVIDSYKEGGFSLGQCNEFVVKNSKIVASDPSGYGIRLSASMASTATIESCEISSFIPVVVREASANHDLTFAGANTMTASNTDGLWCAIGTSAYTTNGTMPTPATGKVTVVLNDEGLNEAGVYGEYKPAAKIGAKSYDTFYEAVKEAKQGDIITLTDDADLEFTDNPQYNNIYASVIDLNGKTLTIKDYDIRFDNVKIENGTIVVAPGQYNGTATFLMYGKDITFNNVDITATGLAGTYLIGLEGESNLNLDNSEIIIDNPSLVNLIAAIACNGKGMTTVNNSNINVKNINGRAFLNTSCKVINSTVTADYVKAGFYIPAGKDLYIDATSTVNISNLVDGKVNGIDLYGNAVYTVADGATVNATVGRN